MTLRVVFAGTPAFALPSLRSLVESQADVAAVITQPDRPKGRGRKLAQPPVKQFAEERGLCVIQADRISVDLTAQVASLQPDVMIVVAFGLIVPPKLLKIPKYGCINVHASLLPRWRGAAPVARAIEAGDSTTGVTMMQMDEGLDTGAIIARRECTIAENDTTLSLTEKLAEVGAQQLRETLDSLPGCLQDAIPQESSAATYAAKLSVAESPIDWQQSASQIVRKIHAYNPWPAARTTYQGMGLRIWSAKVESHGAGVDTAGEVVESRDRSLVIQAGNGAVRIVELQREGKRRMAAADFLSGFAVPAGSRFEQPYFAN